MPLAPQHLGPAFLNLEPSSGVQDGAFADIRVEEMEEAAVRIGKSVIKLGRDIKSWPVWAWIKDVIDAFKRTMPLITDLRNPAMRERHWESLMDEVGKRFDSTSPDFTLDSMVQLRLDQHVEFIAGAVATSNGDWYHHGCNGSQLFCATLLDLNTAACTCKMTAWLYFIRPVLFVCIC